METDERQMEEQPTPETQETSDTETNEVEELFAEFFQEQPQEEKSGEPVPSTTSEDTNSDVAEVEVQEEAPVAQKPAELTPTEKRVLELEKQLQEMKAQAQANAQAQPQPAQTPAPAKEEKVLPKLTIESDEDYRAIFENKDSFIGFVNKIVAQAKTEALEEAYKTIPQATFSYVQQQQGLQQVINDFKAAHSDLFSSPEMQQYVAWTANQVQSEHADWHISQVLEETARRAGQVMGLQQQAKKAEARQVAKAPRVPVPTPKPRTGASDEISSEQRDIMETLGLI